MTEPLIDADALKRYSFSVWSYKQGEIVSLMIHIGDRLGLYRALNGAGPVTAAELAARTGLKERWLFEWLRGQAAARLLDYHDPDRFELTPVGAAVLADETGSLAFAAGAFATPTAPEIVDKLCDAFRTGIGLSYEQLGANAAHRTERMLGPWVRQALVPQIVPALDGVQQKLERGCTVADVGCGSGLALASMAAAFPNSQFHGYDPSSHAIANCHAKVRDMKLTNMQTFAAERRSVAEEPTYDFVITFDCLHDMTRPGRGDRIDSPRAEARRHVADQRHPQQRRLQEEHAQSDARDVLRLLGVGVHVVGAVGTGRRGFGHARFQSGRRRTNGARSRLHALHAARLRRSEQSVLRSAALARAARAL